MCTHIIIGGSLHLEEFRHIAHCYKVYTYKSSSILEDEFEDLFIFIIIEL